MTCLSAGSQAPRTMTSLAYNNSLAPSSALVLTTILWEKFRYPQNYVQLCAVPIQITEGREYLQPNGGISVSYSMTLDNKIRRYTKVRTKSTATIIITSVKRTRALPHSALTSHCFSGFFMFMYDNVIHKHKSCSCGINELLLQCSQKKTINLLLSSQIPRISVCRQLTSDNSQKYIFDLNAAYLRMCLVQSCLQCSIKPYFFYCIWWQLFSYRF